MRATQCIQICRHGQNSLLKFKLYRMRMEGVLSNFEDGRVSNSNQVLENSKFISKGPQRQQSSIHENMRIVSWMSSLQIYCSCVMVSCQYGPKSLWHRLNKALETFLKKLNQLRSQKQINRVLVWVLHNTREINKINKKKD